MYIKIKNTILNSLLFIILITLCSCDKNSVSSSKKEEYFIAFDRGRDVYIYNTLDKSLTNITENLVDTFYWANVSAFSDDGKELLFTLDYQYLGTEEYMNCERDDIFRYNVLSGKTIRLTDNKFQERNPKFSHDKEKIIFQSRDIKNKISNIYMIDRNGNNRKIIVNKDEYEWFPFFHKDDNKFFYTAHRNNICDIYQKNINDDNEINLTNDSDGETELCYIPEKNIILYKTWDISQNTDSGLRLLHLDNQKITHILFDNANDYNVYFAKLSFDAKYICSIFTDGFGHRYIMDLDGNNQIYLGDGFDHEFTKDNKYLIHFCNDGLYKYDISNNDNVRILEIDMWNCLNLEVSSLEE